jgi:hypothetical protein
MSNNRYVGDYPVIGIRPVVDGRRGPMLPFGVKRALITSVVADSQATILQRRKCPAQ